MLERLSRHGAGDRAGSYKGFIACEYEGHHFTDEIPAEQQLKRYVAMCRRILQ